MSWNSNWAGDWTQNAIQFFNLNSIVWSLVFVFILLMAVNLVLAGRHGWAWPFLIAVSLTLKLIIRMVASVFREVASDYDGTGGWDDE